MDSNTFNFNSLISLIKQNLKTFLIVGVLAIILAWFFSGPSFITPLFKSTAIVYPANIEVYSDENETEQLMQIFAASDIRNYLIEKFDLYERFEIERDSKGAITKLLKTYNDRFVVSKTNFESVKLEVWDQDPEIAQAMANEVLDQVNIKIGSLINTSAAGRMQAYKNQMDYQVQVIDSIQTLMSSLSKDKGVLEFENQTRELTRGYIDMLQSAGNSRGADEIKEMMANLQDAGSMFNILNYLSEQATIQHDLISRKFLEERAMAFQNLNYTDVIVSPEVADKKAYPIRWLIMALIVVSSLLLTAITLVILGRK